jgi:hypothetical protein
MRIYITCAFHQVPIVRVIKPRMRWAGRALHRGEMSTKFWSENLKEKTFRIPRRRWEVNIRIVVRNMW